MPPIGHPPSIRTNHAGESDAQTGSQIQTELDWTDRITLQNRSAEPPAFPISPRVGV